MGFIYDTEYTFLIQTRLQRKLSQKQLEWKHKINRRITQQIVVQRRKHIKNLFKPTMLYSAT